MVMRWWGKRDGAELESECVVSGGFPKLNGPLGPAPCGVDFGGRDAHDWVVFSTGDFLMRRS
jgi:hypothetical protein